MASSDTLGDALKRGSRYSASPAKRSCFSIERTSNPRCAELFGHSPPCRSPTNRVLRRRDGPRVSSTQRSEFLPERVSLMHARLEGISKSAPILGNDVEFGSNADEITFPAGSAEWRLVNADQRLSKILLKVCEESLSDRRSNSGPFRTTVENAIAPCFPTATSRRMSWRRSSG